METELAALHLQGTWELVDLPEDKKAIGCKWVFKIKRNADVRMETKVMNDGSHYARIRSLDDRRGADTDVRVPTSQITLRTGLVSADRWSVSRFIQFTDLSGKEKKKICRKIKNLRCTGAVADDEEVSGLFEEVVYDQSCTEWLDSLSDRIEFSDREVIPLPTREVYEEIAAIMRFSSHMELEGEEEQRVCWCGFSKEAEVHAKYKSVTKKVKPVATQLPQDSQQQMESAAMEPGLRTVKKMGHKFTPETLSQLQIGGGDFLTDTEKKVFEEMIGRHGKAFAFSAEEIGCVDPKVIAPMVIFTVPHVPWDLRPIPVPRALLPKLIELLKEKMSMGILEPSMALYSSRWFTVPKKSGALRFIQDLQPANRVTIRNMGAGPIVDEVVDEFAGRSIYSIGDLYSGYDQFQLAMESRDLTTMRTPLGLMRMCTLPQGATNSVAHMQNAMHKVLREFVPQVTIPFIDDIPMKGCAEEDKDESVERSTGCMKFVGNHIRDVEKILQRLEEMHLTLSGVKSRFGVSEILVVGHLCGSFGRRPNPVKVEAITRMTDCGSITEVRRFLGCCIFYRLSVPHYAHVADPLYALLKKRRRFVWELEHHEAMQRLKVILQSPPVLRRLSYDCGRPIIITVDTSPKTIGWAVGQDDEQGVRFASRFGANILSSRQRDYPQVNVVADMLSRARYENEEEMLKEAEKDDIDIWCRVGQYDRELELLPFREELYGGSLKEIGFYLSSLKRREVWSDADFSKIRKKAYGFMLRDGYLWKRPKRSDGDPLRVVDDSDTKQKLLKEFHESLWAGHRGVWATYMKLKERYWWKGIYRSVADFVGSCLHCQYYSKMRYRDGLVPTYSPSLHFTWVIDLVMMPPGLWGMRYLVLAREDLSNFVEGRALRTKSVEGICRFILEEIVCRYGSVGRLRADRGDLNAEEARIFFQRFGVKLRLTTAMNPEGIGKSERGHPPIVHALVKACDEADYACRGAFPSWMTLPWEDGLDRESLLALRIRQLERREEDLADAQQKLKEARLKNKDKFDRTHRLRPRPIQAGDCMTFLLRFSEFYSDFQSVTPIIGVITPIFGVTTPIIGVATPISGLTRLTTPIFGLLDPIFGMTDSDFRSHDFDFRPDDSDSRTDATDATPISGLTGPIIGVELRFSESKADFQSKKSFFSLIFKI
ncbi:hypothetical protein R1sor_003567 [Riccia sorocarpa]|uniref:Integrase catalytic domain-containing protein n=1 Tax=Riccia sorocarpa TaxID=122646 RepID=A0ABD3H1Y2_9MARC